MSFNCCHVVIVAGLTMSVLMASVMTSPEVRQKRSDDGGPLEAVVEQLSAQVSHLTAQLGSVSSELAALKTKTDKADLNIAFHAEFSKDPVQLGPAQRFVLDHVITNQGSGYDATSGEFHAPVSGSYMFVVNFMAGMGDYNYVQVMLDGTLVCYTITHGDGSTWRHASGTVILHVNAGQHVWVERGHDETNAKPIRGHQWTTFSGFLIRADL